MRRSIISATRDSNCSFTISSFELGVDFFELTILPPPALQGPVADKELRFHFIWSHYGNNSRPGQEVGRQLRVLYSIRLNPEGRQRQKDHSTDHPSANKTECSPQQPIGPLDLRELHKSGSEPDCYKSGNQDHQEQNGESKE